MARFDRSACIAIATFASALSALAACATAQAHPDSTRFGICIPASARAGRDVGCFIVTERPIGIVGAAPVYWHVTQLTSPANADSIDARSGAVIDAYGHTWLLTIGDSSWRPRSGEYRKR